MSSTNESPWEATDIGLVYPSIAPLISRIEFGIDPPTHLSVIIAEGKEEKRTRLFFELVNGSVHRKGQGLVAHNATEQTARAFVETVHVLIKRQGHWIKETCRDTDHGKLLTFSVIQDNAAENTDDPSPFPEIKTGAALTPVVGEGK